MEKEIENKKFTLQHNLHLLYENVERQRKRGRYLDHSFRYKNTEIAKKSNELLPFEDILQRCSSNYSIIYEIIEAMKRKIVEITEEIDNER